MKTTNEGGFALRWFIAHASAYPFAYFSKIVSCDDFSSRPDSNSRRIVRTIVSNDDETITVG